MRLPRTSRPPCAPLAELRLGMGDYVAGGACSLPFLDLDGARHRRPLVFGEVTDDLSGYPDLAAEMFSGRQNDPSEWAVMWKEIGADGVWIDLGGGDPELVERVASRTRLPVAVTADDDVLAEVSRLETGTMVLVPRGETYSGPVGGHAIAIRGRSADEIADRCAEAEASGIERIVIDVDSSPVGTGLPESMSLAREIRRRALSGEEALRHPTLGNVTGCWKRGFEDARAASMWEAEAALAAMMSGADILVVRGPGAADMARVYGEELADL